MMQRSILILILCFVPVSFVAALEVVKVYPKPTYRLTADNSDKNQLVDGVQVKYPIWTDRRAVGWGGVSPVRIILSGSELKSSSPKIVRLHTAVGRHAGVLPILRVDAYDIKSGFRSSAQHISDYKKTENNQLKRKKYYVDIPFSKRVDRLGLIIHVEKGGVYLDEVEVLEAEHDFLELSSERSIQIDEMESDSNRRLIAQYKIDADVAGQAKALGENTNTPVISIIDCFEKNLGNTSFPTKDYSLYSVDDLNLHGQLCLKIINSKGFSNLRLDSLVPFDAYEIKSQIVRGGLEIHDAVERLKEDTVLIRSKSVVYLLVNIDKAAYVSGDSKAVFNIFLDDDSTQLSFILRKRYCEKLLNPMDFNVWAYTYNQPIWNEHNKAALAKELMGSGVNIHTIHPRYIPRLDSEWTPNKKKELLKELRLFDEKIEYFLWVTDWSLSQQSITLKRPGELSVKSKISVQKWLAEFNQFLDDNNLNIKKMVLYPVDEPFGDKLVALKAITSFLSEEAADITIYANPSAARKGSARENDLADMAAAKIFWQPSWKYIQKYGAQFFQRSSARWMIYDNPTYPAKNASPAKFFRALPWRAWSVGASGFGTWSFDDTQGTSAFDDFDGRRSDWALVYESDQLFISSRRWLALLRGIEDIRLSPYWPKVPGLEGRIRSGKLANEMMTNQFFEAMRNCEVN